MVLELFLIIVVIFLLMVHVIRMVETALMLSIVSRHLVSKMRQITLGLGLGISLEINLMVKRTVKGAVKGIAIIFNEINHRVLERAGVDTTVAHTIGMARR